MAFIIEELDFNIKFNQKKKARKVTGIINLQSVLSDGMLCHVKELRSESDTNDSSTSNGEMEIDSRIFDAPPVTVEMESNNTEDEVPPLQRSTRRKRPPLHIGAMIRRGV